MSIYQGGAAGGHLVVQSVAVAHIHHSHPGVLFQNDTLSVAQPGAGGIPADANNGCPPGRNFFNAACGMILGVHVQTPANADGVIFGLMHPLGSGAVAHVPQAGGNARCLQLGQRPVKFRLLGGATGQVGGLGFRKVAVGTG